MNEEEKEAIDKLKSVINNDTGVISDDIQDDEIETILNLIDKQQKEIEDLKDKNKTLERLLQGDLYEMYKYYKELAGKYQGNCISKDKIRELKELVHKTLDDNGITRGYQLTIDNYFKELMGE